jgi:hypothetical protein
MKINKVIEYSDLVSEYRAGGSRAVADTAKLHNTLIRRYGSIELTHPCCRLGFWGRYNSSGWRPNKAFGGQRLRTNSV